MNYSLRELPLLFDTTGGIRICTSTAKSYGIDKPGIQFASLVLLPCPSLDAIETGEYATDAEAREGQKRFIEKYSSWSRDKVQQEIRARLF